ncbi:MAG: hypothetical protein ABEK50_15745 [bacterium]
MSFIAPVTDKKRTPFTPPEELRSRSGKHFAEAREALNLERSDVSDVTKLDYGKLLKFEKGGIELNRKIWRAYVKAVLKKDVPEDISLYRASVLLRGVVNETRLYGRN